jgi:mono/diheme cytochrome c family protein
MLNELGHTIRNDVHWGLVMTNDLRWLKLASVLTGQKDLYHGAHMHPLGQAGHGSGDPAGLAVAADGRVVVTLGGSAEIATGREDDFRLASANVGRRPTGVTIASDSGTAYVLNTFDNSISVVDLHDAKVTHTLSLGPAPKLSLAERGEQLFYDARLSHDGWMSCHSCHTDGHTNGQRNDNFSDKTFGAPKRVLSLLTSMDTAPFGWLGSAKTLEQQIEKSIVHTMQGKEEVAADVVPALAAYLRTLGPPPVLAKLRGEEDREAIARGEKIFAAQKCASCHAPPAYTTPQVVDVGLKDELDHREFNPPSLLGVGQRRRLLHDARAASLAEVFTHHGHQLRGDLSAEEIADLVEFLRSL